MLLVIAQGMKSQNIMLLVIAQGMKSQNIMLLVIVQGTKVHPPFLHKMPQRKQT
jgi:hypothetical protein